jgi:hypothetical protein
LGAHGALGAHEAVVEEERALDYAAYKHLPASSVQKRAYPAPSTCPSLVSLKTKLVFVEEILVRGPT